MTESGSDFQFGAVWDLEPGVTSRAEAVTAFGREADVTEINDGNPILEWERSKRNAMAGIPFYIRKVVLEFDGEGRLGRPVQIYRLDPDFPSMQFSEAQIARLDREFAGLELSIANLADGWGWFGLPVNSMYRGEDGRTFLRWHSGEREGADAADVYLFFDEEDRPLTYRVVYADGVFTGETPSLAELKVLVAEGASLEQALAAIEAKPRWIQRDEDGSVSIRWNGGYLHGFSQRNLELDAKGRCVSSGTPQTF